MLFWIFDAPHSCRISDTRIEQIVMRALSGDKLRLDGSEYTPTGMHGWSRIVFQRDADGKKRVMLLEDLLEHLPDWEHQ